ncbi:MAG: porin family protein [Salibacteraceae bacterium]
MISSSKIFLLMAVFSLSIPINAQDSEPVDRKGHLELSPMLGLNAPTLISNYSNSSLEPSIQMRVGYNFGVNVNYMLTNAFSIRSGVLLNSKGFSEDNPEFSGDDHNRIAINYLEMPFHAQYHFTNRLKGLNVYLGPYIALALGGDSYGMQDGEDIEQVKYIPKSGDVKASELAADEVPIQLFDFGVSAGIGYTLFKNFTAQAGYSIGLRNINNTIVDDTNMGMTREADDFKDVHSLFSLTFIYKVKSFQLLGVGS